MPKADHDFDHMKVIRSELRHNSKFVILILKRHLNMRNLPILPLPSSRQKTLLLLYFFIRGKCHLCEIQVSSVD